MVLDDNRIEIEDVNEVYVKVHCSDSIAYELRGAFQFKVPGAEFSPQFRNRLWDGKIYLFSIHTRLIYRGLVNELLKFCEERGIEVSYDHNAANFSMEEAKDFVRSLNPSYEPRDYQMISLINAIRHKRITLLSPTASGKSLSIYLILHKIMEECKRGLIIVPKVSLVEQLYKDFQDYSSKNSWDVENHVHKIYQGQDKDTNKNIIISTWQSLYELPKKYFRQFDYVINDEVHLASAKSLTYILTSMENAKYRIGASGTLDDSKTNQLVIQGLFGPIKVITTTKELMDKKHISDFQIKCLLLKHPKEACKIANKFIYQEEIDYLISNEARNKFISNLTISLEGNTLVLFQYVDKHGKILYDLIKNKAGKRKVFFISGTTSVDDRENIREIIESQKDAIVVASFGTTSTGINIKNLHNVIFASPSKSRIRNLQSIGRSLRKSDNKEIATLFDIADDLRVKTKENYTLTHFGVRLKMYMEEKFKFKIYKIDLKG